MGPTCRGQPAHVLICPSTPCDLEQSSGSDSKVSSLSEMWALCHCLGASSSQACDIQHNMAIPAPLGIRWEAGIPEFYVCWKSNKKHRHLSILSIPRSDTAPGSRNQEAGSGKIVYRRRRSASRTRAASLPSQKRCELMRRTPSRRKSAILSRSTSVN
jgi:hypothetical protein